MKEKNSKQVQSMLNEIGKDREKQEKTMQLDDFNFQVYLEINLIKNTIKVTFLTFFFDVSIKKWD